MGTTRQLLNIKGREDQNNDDSSLPPKPLLIGTLSLLSPDDGDFPVVLLLHGFMMQNCFYSQLIQHGSLQDVLPSNIHPILQKLALSDRGGKAAVALALIKVASSALKLSALFGIDPVEETTLGKTSPVVLTGVPFEQNGTPVMVIGSGLGAIKKNFLSSPCAPKGVNHENF
ncbi:Chlorophyllase-2-like protein [Drosera capensis]